MRRCTAFLCFGTLLLVSTASARTWYIMPDGTGDAPTIQAGIDSSAAGDTVLVASGTYTEPCQNGLSMLVVDSGLSLIAENGADATVLDAQGTCRVLYIGPMADSVSVQGFTITGGDAAGEDGGGVCCYDCPARMTMCVISGNTAFHGGGLFAQGDRITVTDCEICYNTASAPPDLWGAGGGAICLGATLTGCNIHDNYASEEGGGVWSTGTVAGCVFSYNSAGRAGGAVASRDVSDCIFSGNTGTGSCAYSWGAIEDCVFTQNSGSCIYADWLHSGPAVRNCTFYLNSGSALKIDFASFAIMANCTIYGNVEDAIVLVPGWSHCEGTMLWIENTIIVGTTEGKAVNACTTIECVVTIDCCCLWDNEGGDFVGGIAGQEGLNGNFSACPSFCFADAGDFHLCDSSPCAEGNHPSGYSCGLIGAWGVECSCGPSETDQTRWGAIKAMYK